MHIPTPLQELSNNKNMRCVDELNTSILLNTIWRYTKHKIISFILGLAGLYIVTDSEEVYGAVSRQMRRKNVYRRQTERAKEEDVKNCFEALSQHSASSAYLPPRHWLGMTCRLSYAFEIIPYDHVMLSSFKLPIQKNKNIERNQNY